MPEERIGFIAPYEACPLCDGRRLAPDFELVVAGTRLGWSLCRDCDLTFQNPRLDEETIRGIYAGDAYWNGTGAFSGSGYASYEARDRIRLAQARRRLDLVRAVSGIESGRLLDVACATGIFAFSARERGFEVEGIEPSPRMAEFARTAYGIDVRCATLEETILEPERYDVVSLWGADSHFLHPLEGFRSLVRSLKPGGVLAMSYQNFHHPVRRVFPGLKRSWNALYNLSDRSFEVLMDRVGLEVIHRRMEWQRVPTDHLFRVLKLPAPRWLRRGSIFVPAISFSLAVARKEA